MTVATPHTTKEIPLAPGLPVLGNALALATDVAGFLTEQYKQMGVFVNRKVIHMIDEK